MNRKAKEWLAEQDTEKKEEKKKEGQERRDSCSRGAEGLLEDIRGRTM